MTENASLDDFLDVDDQQADSAAFEDDGVADGRDADATDDSETGSGDGGETTDAARDVRDEAADATPSSAIEGVTATYAWSPDGETCEECGSVVKRRWRDGSELVCGSCKDW